MKIFATVVLAILVIVAALIFILSSTCALSSGMSHFDRMTFAAFALADAGAIAAGIWTIVKLNRKT